MVKYVRYDWDDFLAKMDYEGTDYMIQELDPRAVPKELEEAHKTLKAAYAAWNAIISEHTP